MKWIPWVGGAGLVLMLFTGCAGTVGYSDDYYSGPYYANYGYAPDDFVIYPYGHFHGHGYHHHGWSSTRHGYASHGSAFHPHTGGHVSHGGGHAGHGGGGHHH